MKTKLFKTLIYLFISYIIIAPVFAGLVGNNKLLFKSYDKIIIHEINSGKKYEINEKNEVLQFKNELADTLFIISLDQCDPDYTICFWNDNKDVGALQYDSKRNIFANVLVGNYFNTFSQKANNDDLTTLLQKYIVDFY